MRLQLSLFPWSGLFILPGEDVPGRTVRTGGVSILIFPLKSWQETLSVSAELLQLPRPELLLNIVS